MVAGSSAPCSAPQPASLPAISSSITHQDGPAHLFQLDGVLYHVAGGVVSHDSVRAALHLLLAHKPEVVVHAPVVEVTWALDLRQRV
eukprot:7645044-Pyramimonas_sp.AAC.1